MSRNKVESFIMPLSNLRWRWISWIASVRHRLRALDQSRTFNLAEISAVSMVYFWVVWSVVPAFAQRGLSFFPLVLVFFTVVYVAFFSPTVLHRDSWAGRGLAPPWLFLRVDNLGPALGGFGVFTLWGGLGILLGGACLFPGCLAAIDGQAFFLRLGLYFFSALGQNYLFLAFFLRRWQAVFPAGRIELRHSQAPGRPEQPSTLAADWAAVAANALLFSAYHLPNAPVMVMTFLLGLVWGRLFICTPNLIVAAFGHAILGTLLNIGLKVNLQLGAAYYGGCKGFYRAVFAFLDPMIGGRF